MPDKVNSKHVFKSTETKLFLGVAALALGQAVQHGNGHLTSPALVWLTLALICSGASVISQRRSFPSISTRELRFVLIVGLIWQIFQLLTTLPGIYILPERLPQLWVFKVGIAVAGLSALLSLAPDAWYSQRLKSVFFIIAMVFVFGSGVWVIRASPKPFIDTFEFQQTSSKALLNGKNPYVQTLPNIYGNMDFYGEKLVRDGKMTIGNPYPPLSIYLSFLGYLTGQDIRYSHLVAIIIAGILIALYRPGRDSLLISYIFLFTPRVFFVLEQAWTEPLMVFLIALVLWCTLERPSWVPVALGLLFASKQYLIFMLPVLFIIFPRNIPRFEWFRKLGWISGAAIIVTAPLAFWNIPAFLWNVGFAQWYQVLRLDALSYLALYARVVDQTPSQLIPFIALAGAILLVWRFTRRTPSGFAISLAFCLFIFFAFNKQAFCNYYYLVIGVLCSGFAVLPMRVEIPAIENSG